MTPNAGPFIKKECSVVCKKCSCYTKMKYCTK